MCNSFLTSCLCLLDSPIPLSVLGPPLSLCVFISAGAGHSRSPKRLILVISGCQYKDCAPRQKSPCMTTKQPLLCNAPMMPLRFLARTMTESGRRLEEIAHEIRDGPNKDTVRCAPSVFSYRQATSVLSVLDSALTSRPHSSARQHDIIEWRGKTPPHVSPLSNLPDEATLLCHH